MLCSPISFVIDQAFYQNLITPYLHFIWVDV